MANGKRDFTRWRVGLTAATLTTLGATYLGIAAADETPPALQDATPDALPPVGAVANVPRPLPATSPTGEVQQQQQSTRVVVVPRPRARTRAS